MRILFVNWAPVHFGAEVGGGVNHYSQSMTTELVKRGHEVFSLSAGFVYSPIPGVRVQKGHNFKGVITSDLVNSPILAPAVFNFGNPELECGCPPVEKAFRGFLGELSPDVVHFHNIEGLSANCIPIAKESGAFVLYSLHNYHLVCSQVGLLHQGKRICEDFQGGKRCISCVTPPSRFPERTLRVGSRILRSLGGFSGKRPANPMRWKRLLANQIRRITGGVLKDGQPGTSPGISIETNPSSFNEMGSLYAVRRKKMISAVNQADSVLAVSHYVKKLFTDMGIDPRMMKVNHIGSKMADVDIQPREDRGFGISRNALRAVFLGVADELKGLPFLLETLNGMEEPDLSRIELHIYARGIGRWKESHPAHGETLRRLRRKLSGFHMYDGYQFEALPDILRDMDLGIVPPIWHDNAPQVVFEMLAMKVPVLGARIGGIPDFVHHDKNGMLFEPGASNDLAEKLERIISRPDCLREFRSAIRPIKSLSDHAVELETFYGYGPNLS